VLIALATLATQLSKPVISEKNKIYKHSKKNCFKKLIIKKKGVKKREFPSFIVDRPRTALKRNGNY
jgi:hypothetical protein